MTSQTGVRASETLAIEEPYWRFSFDAEAASARTDTPDLLGTFRAAEEAAAYQAMDACTDEVHADLAHASLGSFPVE